jgi:hypothetical protein
LKESALHRNSFRVLGATVRDNRHRIVELAEQKALELDPDLCQKARSALTNPRTRLTAEMAWLPGVSATKADQLLRLISDVPRAIRSESRIPALAHANLMAAVFESMDEYGSESDIAKFILKFAERIESLDCEEILRDINEDRQVSGFPEIRTLDLVDAEVAERKRYYRNVIMDALNNMPSAELVDVLTRAVVDGSHGSETFELIDEVVDAYEVETRFFLGKEAENVSKLVETVRRLAGRGETIIEPLIRRIEQVVGNWKKVAHPIQLRKKAQGLDHQASTAIVYEIRNLAMELFDDHGLIFRAEWITRLLMHYFAESPVIVERLEQDISAIRDIARRSAGG